MPPPTGVQWVSGGVGSWPRAPRVGAASTTKGPRSSKTRNRKRAEQRFIGYVHASAIAPGGGVMKALFQMYAAYNAWANERLYGAAARISDLEYRRDRGAFFGSLHGTLNH